MNVSQLILIFTLNILYNMKANALNVTFIHIVFISEDIFVTKLYTILKLHTLAFEVHLVLGNFIRM